MTRSRRFVAAVAVVLALVAAASPGLVLTVAPPCPGEDAAGTVCGWNAATRGNGVGRSFLVVGDAVVSLP